MPWSVGKSDSCPPGKPFAVIKDSDGSTTACHATRESAQQQIAALYANESAEVKPQLIPTGGASRMLRELSEEGTVVTEGAAKSGLLNIQIISPGWGSSGYYSPQVLEQAAADKVFPAGTQMFLDHPTALEADERPNRSVKDLAAVLSEDARWNGEALVARARTFGPYREAVAEMVDAIGVSIRADAEVSEGEAEGREGIVIERLTNARSIDYVTAPGRGGKILQVLESAHAQAIEEALAAENPETPTETPTETPPPEAPAEPVTPAEPPAPESAPTSPAAPVADPAATTAETHLSQEEKMPEEVSGSGGTAPPVVHSRQVYEAQIAEARAENLRLKAREQARTVITEDLAQAILPQITINRLSAELLESLPMASDELDVRTLRDRISVKRDQAETELGEGMQMRGLTGQPHGLGGSVVQETSGRGEEFQSRTAESLTVFGLTEEAAKSAAKGR